MTDKKRAHWTLDWGAFLFFGDLIFKIWIRHNPEFTWYFFSGFGVEYFANPGIAFGLAVPNWLILTITPVAIFILGQKFYKQTGFWLLVLGALSNFLDRLIFGATTDYIRVFTGVINLADGLIVAGMILMINRQKNNNQRTKINC